VDFDEQLEAISDYMRASWDRAYWGKSGDVHENSFESLDDNLRRTWRHLRDVTEIQHAFQSTVDRGKLLYFECMKHRVTVQQMTPPEYFVPGCFHLLADVPEIGWHPEYESMLKINLLEVL